jgi:spoIIIJ-associated protein
MTGFLGRLFGGKKEAASETQQVIEGTLAELFDRAGLELQFSVARGENSGKEDSSIENYSVEVSGADEEQLVSREGQLLDAIQLFLTRVCQHRFPDLRVNITVDNSGYRDELNKELLDLAEKLKGLALEKGKPVYFRALAPRDRKLVHQYLADDARVKSRSVGEGLYKKIKIYPADAGRDSSPSAEL